MSARGHALPEVVLAPVRRGPATPPPSPGAGAAPEPASPGAEWRGGKLSHGPHLGSPGLICWRLEAWGRGRAQRYQGAHALTLNPDPRLLPAWVSQESHPLLLRGFSRRGSDLPGSRGWRGGDLLPRVRWPGWLGHRLPHRESEVGGSFLLPSSFWGSLPSQAAARGRTPGFYAEQPDPASLNTPGTSTRLCLGGQALPGRTALPRRTHSAWEDPVWEE